MTAPRWLPLVRTHYDRSGTPITPEPGQECRQTQPKIIQCPQDKVLVVTRDDDEYGSPQPEFFCCCPAPCEEVQTPGEAEYGRCYCFSGKVDDTGDDCDMQWLATVAGAAVGTIAECSGPFLLNEVYVERGGENPTYCDWVYTTGPVVESNDECPEVCAGNDAAGVPRQVRTCHCSIWIRCTYNPCAVREYLAEVIVGKNEIHSCNECEPGGPQQLVCNQACGTLYFYIPTDPCGCMMAGTYNGYPYRYQNDEYWCINTGIPGLPHNCDPWGANPSHTLTLEKVHSESCKPFNCAAPPCATADVGAV